MRKINKLTIGYLASAANVKIETVRHYQRLNLICEPTKPLNGFRIYPLATVGRIQFIKSAQKLGFSLNEISQLLELGNHHCTEVQVLAEEKRKIINKQIEGLSTIKTVLDGMIASCQDGKDTDSCAFIDALSQKELLND